jgi:hypothetical protein
VGRTRSFRYDVSDDTLRVTESKSGRVVWEGNPLGFPVHKALPVRDSDDCLVLLDAWRDGEPLVPTSRPFLDSLIRVTPDGSVVWKGELPSRGPDYYTAIEWSGERLVAQSFSSFRVILDPETGRIVEQVWLK